MKFRIGMLLALFVLLGVVLMPVAARAETNMRSGATATVRKDETVDASAYLAGGTVTMAGTVHGDVFCAGQNITITGTVEGDVICAGQTVQISGTVLGSVQVAGQVVTVSGLVGHSLTVFGENVVVSSDAVVSQDATIFAGNLQLGGKVARDAVLGGQTVTLTGVVSRNVTAAANHLSLTSGNQIGGNLDYTSRNQAQLENGATVAGKTTRHEPQHRTQNEWAGRIDVALYWLGAFLFFGLVLMALAPRSFVAVQRLQLTQGGWALLVGVSALFLTPLLAVLLVVTLIGAPLGAALLLLWPVLLVASYIYSAYTIGAWVAERAGWKLLWARAMALLIGVVIVLLLALIPVVGPLFVLLALIWGLGGVTLALGTYIRNSNRPVAVSKKVKA